MQLLALWLLLLILSLIGTLLSFIVEVIQFLTVPFLKVAFFVTCTVVAFIILGLFLGKD